MTRRRIRTIAYRAIPIVVLLAAWQWAVWGSNRREFLFGSPVALVRVVLSDLSQLDILYDFILTMATAAAGLSLGTALGAVVGFSVWINPKIGRLVRPYIIAIGALPIFAIAPMLIIWFGIGMTPKIVMATFSVCIGVTVSTYAATADLHALHEEWMSGLGLSRLERLRSVLAPEVLSSILEAMRTNAGIATVGTFIGEFVVSQRGLGRYVLKSGGVYDTPRVEFGLILIMAVALLLGLIGSTAASLWAPRGDALNE